MSDLHDLIMALPEGTTLEVRRTERDGTACIRLDLRSKRGVGSTVVAIDPSLATLSHAPSEIATALIDRRARAILDEGRLA